MKISECRSWRLYLRFAALVLVILILAGCAPERAYRSQPKFEKQLTRMGHTIQVGAFSKVENASRLTELLLVRGVEATYFVANTGLYKVRFGNYALKSEASEKAESLKSAGIIDEYYIVSPDEYTVAKRQKYGSQYLREEIVKTARDFVGVPYLWGGSASDKGFDCSGLTMTVYQLNGLDLPRSSREQYETGIPVERDHLSNGDLVFFSTSSSNKASHVGVYAGDGRFIHAPGRGKTIRVDFLSGSYFKKRYLGGRSYL
jgi:cell wall-associated NlpC family hydrolase